MNNSKFIPVNTPIFLGNEKKYLNQCIDSGWVSSDGEFVVPADVVSGLGNGSSDAGANKLEDMMDRVRELRTGGKAQPPAVPDEMMLPA